MRNPKYVHQAFEKYLRILILILVFNSAQVCAFGQRTINLYEGKIPGSKHFLQGNMDDSTYRAKLSPPNLTVFEPVANDRNKKRSCVIILPGGGYGSLVIDREGYEVAKEFTEMGMVAFVLQYRLPDSLTMLNPSEGPLQDALEAICRVREISAGYNIDKNKVGLVGFSAGGHLASTAGTHFRGYQRGGKSEITARPDFMILVYPVISFSAGLVHEGSMNNLLGLNPSQKQRKKFSNELHVTSLTPPTFLVHASDDIWVPPGNSLKFYEALQNAGVSAELHIYHKGGHGFAFYPARKEWLRRCKNWMTSKGFLNAN